MDRLKALAVFKTVVEQGSFARAADTLDLSPAVVTRTVQELEALLAVRLLQRTTRRVTLTAVGHDVLERARGLLASFDELSSMSSLCGAEAAGRVRLGAPAWLGRRLLGAVAAAYLASCPKVSLELRMHASESGLFEGDGDLALCLESELKPCWIARKVAQVSVGLYAAPAYLARRGEPATPDELAQHDGLAGGSARADATWHFQPADGGDMQPVEIRPVLHSNQPETLMSAAVHGAGIALLPDLLAEEAVASGKLRRLMPGWRAEPLSLHLAYESRQHQPLSVRKLIEVLASAFEDLAETRNEPHGQREALPKRLLAAMPPLPGGRSHQPVALSGRATLRDVACLLAA